QLRVGARMPVGLPRNNFPLVPARGYLFLAGGIGITCLLPMAREVAGRGTPWQLIYTGKSRARMALIDEVTALDRERVRVLPQDERGQLCLETLIATQRAGTAVYGCGPTSMLEALGELVLDRGDLSLHTERFTGVAPEAGAAVQLELNRSRRTVRVAGQRTL